MGRPPTVNGMARTRRKPPFSYRPPVAMREALLARAAASGLSLNAFITAALFGPDAPPARRRVPVAKQDIAVLLAQAARIRDLLGNVPTLPRDEQGEVIKACRDALVEIRTSLMQLLGRAP